MPAPAHYDDHLTIDPFGDNHSLNHDVYDHQPAQNDVHSDASTVVTRHTDGTFAPEPHVDEHDHGASGQTPAEELASHYRTSTALDESRDRNSVASVHALDHLDDGRQVRFEDSTKSLVNGDPEMGRSSKYEHLDYAEPSYAPYDTTRGLKDDEKSSPLQRFMGVGKYPLEQRIEAKKRGIGRQRYPFVVWGLSIIMVAVFIKELVVQAQAQGSIVSLKPVVNPMLGPSSSALINLGARFPPCMKSVQGLPVSTQMACLNDTANPPDRLCTIEEVCGFGGFHGEDPNQWYRFIIPIFLHAGFVHVLLNLLAQLTVSAQIEKEMGSGGFFILYFAAGIFGNVLGGNFSLVGAPSLGASGSIFGTVAVTWVDLLAHWKYTYRPVRRLVVMSIELAVGIALGYIPYVDNFAHLGGFFMGLLVGTTLYPVISATKRHKTIMWGFRIAALPVAIVLMVVLIRNFYTSDPYAACQGCRYLSCFPTNANDHCQGTGFSTSNSTGSSSI